jgi:hypothetical protein
VATPTDVWSVELFAGLDGAGVADERHLVRCIG